MQIHQYCSGISMSITDTKGARCAFFKKKVKETVGGGRSAQAPQDINTEETAPSRCCRRADNVQQYWRVLAQKKVVGERRLRTAFAITLTLTSPAFGGATCVCNKINTSQRSVACVRAHQQQPAKGENTKRWMTRGKAYSCRSACGCAALFCFHANPPSQTKKKKSKTTARHLTGRKTDSNVENRFKCKKAMYKSRY